MSHNKTRSFTRFSDDLGLYISMIIKGDAVTIVSLTDEPPTSSLEADHPYLVRVMDHIRTGRDDLRDIPVSLPLSGFTREVLEALRDIPQGEVRTYGEMASLLGRPLAARAVGNACARNPVPVIVPCHRVVPSTGGLGNYSGGYGPPTKALLVEMERRACFQDNE